jgi:hypothetical protein
MKTSHSLAARIPSDHEVGRAIPCGPRFNIAKTARRGLTGTSVACPRSVLLMSIIALSVSLLFLCPYSARAQGGVPLWTNRLEGVGNDLPPAMAVDHTGNVFVTGYSTDSLGNEDYLTIKYSNAGLPLWTNRYDGPANGSDRATAIAVDGSGNVFVTGESWSQSFDYATIKYSSLGVPLWTNRYDGPGNASDLATAIAVDSSGTVYVTGFSSGGSDFDYATIAYSNSGVPLWTNRYDGANSLDEASGVAVDANGNLFVTGYSYDGSTILPASLSSDFANGGVLECRRAAVDQSVRRASTLVRRGSSYCGGQWRQRVCDGNFICRLQQSH